jgi:inorganic pyrophosphatase
MLIRNLNSLPAFDGRSNRINVVIEASKGSRIKLKYDETLEIFRAEKALPIGLVFPFDFGFIPSTLGGDRDPLDVLVLSESGLPWGTLVLGKVVGIVKCEQTQKGSKERNDRIIALPLDAKSLEPMQPDITFDSELKQAIAEFFIKYNELQDKKLRVIAIEGPRSAIAAIESAMVGAEPATKSKQTKR